MKVKELIEKLNEQDPEAMVITDGYESGYDELKFVQKKQIVLNYYNTKEMWYYGAHADPVMAEEKPIVTAVYLPRQ